jgi:hypothetical protein
MNLMMQRRSVGYVLAVTLALVVAASVSGWAQQSSDLSGKWVFAKAKSEGVPTVPRIFNSTGAPAGSDELVVTQTPAAVTIKIGGVVLLYRVDGTEGNISAEGRAGFPAGKASWENGKLVANLVQEVFSAAKGDYMKVPLKEVYSLSDGTLTLERTRTHIDGKTTSEKLVYTKATS